MLRWAEGAGDGLVGRLRHFRVGVGSEVAGFGSPMAEAPLQAHALFEVMVGEDGPVVRGGGRVDSRGMFTFPAYEGNAMAAQVGFWGAAERGEWKGRFSTASLKMMVQAFYRREDLKGVSLAEDVEMKVHA